MLFTSQNPRSQEFTVLFSLLQCLVERVFRPGFLPPPRGVREAGLLVENLSNGQSLEWQGQRVPASLFKIGDLLRLSRDGIQVQGALTETGQLAISAWVRPALACEELLVTLHKDFLRLSSRSLSFAS